MNKTVFTRELRLLLCPNCGAPIEGALTGGSVSCPYCHATAFLTARDERRDVASAAAQPTMSESERFQRLRAQNHVPWLSPPPALLHLCVDGRIPPDHIAQAFAELQRARQELLAGGSFGAAERLYFVAIMIYEHLAPQRRDAEIRALLETARDVLTDPLHRQVLHGMLARNAARAGDHVAAEGWLALQTPYAMELRMDTAYRLSRAYVSTHAGDLAGVLRVLGTRVDDVPLAGGYEEPCGLMRANALERTGAGQEALGQLAQLASMRPSGAQTLAEIVARNAELGLCPQSLPALLRARR
jgi:uncharacterized Zn finger protein (UPF0148 family)